MDLCKRRRLQCERSVVHSGKSLSHAVSLDARSLKTPKKGNRVGVFLFSD